MKNNQTNKNKFYDDNSSFLTIKNDDCLSKFYLHLCGYVANKPDVEKTLLVNQNNVWPKDDVIKSLNYLHSLVEDGLTYYTEQDSYSALGLLQKRKNKVAIVLAGGGYAEVCSLHEDLPVSVELHKNGFSVFSFVYPVKEKSILANTCLKNFIKYLFENQSVLNIEMTDYIVVGFSAGAHLAASIATDNFGLSIDIPKPFLLGLCYPVITMLDFAEQGTMHNLLGTNPSLKKRKEHSIELHISDDYPNVFIWACNKDNVVPYDNSLLMVDSLKKKKIGLHFESFDNDAHGWGLANSTLAEGWLKRMLDYYSDLLRKR